MAYRRPEPLTREHVTAGFDCGKESLNEWLVRYALPSQAARSARVFVTTQDDNETVVGYYALTAGSIEPREAMERTAKGQPAQRPIPIALLARLAVDLENQRKGLGRSLLQDAMARAYQAAELVGFRAILVHAKDEEARAFYERYGFESSPTDPLHLMVLMKDVEKFISERKG